MLRTVMLLRLGFCATARIKRTGPFICSAYLVDLRRKHELGNSLPFITKGPFCIRRCCVFCSVALLALGPPQQVDDEEALATLPSQAPERGQRGLLLKKQPSQSVRDLLGTVAAPDMT